MSDATTAPDPLSYAPPPALHRRRWVRRLGIRLTVFALVIAAGVTWGPVAWRRAELLYRQRQCLRYTAPPDTVVCSEQMPSGGRMFSFSFEAPDPAVPYVVLRSAEPSFRVRPGGPLLFMHERTTASGQRRLVILRRNDASLRQSWDLPVAYSVTLVEPATFTAPPAAEASSLIEVLPREYTPPPEAGSGERSELRFFAGQPHPSDPSRFTVRYQRGSRAGVLHGTLEDPPPYASAKDESHPVLRLEAEEQ